MATARASDVLGTLLSGAKFALKGGVSMALQNPQLLSHMAEQFYFEETNKDDWARLPKTEQLLWQERVRIAMRVITRTFKL